MRHRFAPAWALALALLSPVYSQIPHPQQRTDREVDLPNSKPKMDDILKADHEKDLKEVTLLVQLAHQLKAELEKNDHNVLSISSIKTVEEIEKLSKRIHSRIVH